MSDGDTTGPGGTLAPLVDHTALAPETTRADVDRLCREARWGVLADEVAAVVEVAGDRARVKVILETATLTPREILKAGRVAAGAGAHYLETSTGFHPAGGATSAAVALLRMAGGPDVGVKAAGGVRGHDDALAMVAAGTSRIGTSRGLDLVGCARPLPDPLHVYLER